MGIKCRSIDNFWQELDYFFLAVFTFVAFLFFLKQWYKIQSITVGLQCNGKNKADKNNLRWANAYGKI